MNSPKKTLSAPARLELALLAYRQQGIYGALTDLAACFGVSRWLVYHLVRVLMPLLLEVARPKPPGPPPPSSVLQVDRRHLHRATVTLKVVGNVSLEGIQRCLEEILGVHRSIGYLSEVITQAQEHASAFQHTLSYEGSGVGLLDELFDHRAPILGVVEPHSTAVLLLDREEARDGDTWGVHLLDLQAQGFAFTGVASDRAQGLTAGVHEALGEAVVHQADWGHLFGQVARLEATLERKASGAIQAEHERWHVLDSARSDRVITPRIEAWEQAPTKMDQAIALYEDFHSLASELYGLFTPVSPGGRPRSRPAIEGDLTALLSLLSRVVCPPVQEIGKRLEEARHSLLGFWEDWERRLWTLQEAIPQPPLLEGLLWEYFLGRSKPTPSTQEALQRARAFVDTQTGPQAPALRAQVAGCLDALVRSSALGENVNSWVRPYLHAHRGASQGFLDLVALYHNLRPYRRGKRKGHPPFELLGLDLPDDWLSMVGLART